MAAFEYNTNSPRRASIIKDMRSDCELALDSRRHERSTLCTNFVGEHQLVLKNTAEKSRRKKQRVDRYAIMADLNKKDKE